MGIEGEQSVARTGEVVDLDERSWLPRHRGGDHEAFGELLSAYQGRVWRYLGRCGINGEARDDLFQEIFMRVHTAAGRYEPSRPLEPWIFTIAANAARNHLRDRAARARVVDPQVEAPDTADSGPGVERRVAAERMVEWLERAIAALPDGQREVLLLAGVEGLSHEAVAEALGLTVGAVKTRLRRGRLALARARAALEGVERP